MRSAVQRAVLFARTRRDRFCGIRNDGWMLSAPSLQALDGILRSQQPALILECGSGRSTVTLAQAACSYGGRMVSLEHDPRFYDRTRRWLAEHEDDVELRLAPLAGGWYARSGWEDLKGIDLLIIDGPPNLPDNPRNAREGAMRLLADRISPGATIVIDDTNRPEEREMTEAWQTEYGLSFVRTIRHPHADGELTILRRPSA